MDHTQRTSTSKNNAYANESSYNNESGGELQRSIFADASGLIGNQVRRELFEVRRELFPPSPTSVPSTPSTELPKIIKPQLASALFENEDLNEDLMDSEEALLQQFSKRPKASIRVNSLTDGGIYLTLPSAVSDAEIKKFLLVGSKSGDLIKVTSVFLRFRMHVTGALLHDLSQALPKLNSLDLTGCSQFNEDDLVHLAQMKNLKNLTLAGCNRIGKVGLTNLFNLIPNLEMLDLTSCSQVDDEILSSLQNIYQLKHLILTACSNFTDAGMHELAKLENLESLILDQCPQISDVGLRNISFGLGFRKLTQINLINCPLVTKDGVSFLKKTLKQLEHINANH